MMMMDEVPLTGIFLAGGSISAELTVIHNANMCCQDNFRKKRQSGKHLAKDTNYLTSMGVQINYAKLFRDEKQIKAVRVRLSCQSLIDLNFCSNTTINIERSLPFPSLKNVCLTLILANNNSMLTPK